MGVSIQGINLESITLDHEISDQSEFSFSETYVIESFERSLLKKEIILFDDYGYDEYSKTSLCVAYSSYGDVRNDFCQVFVGKTSNSVFNECFSLKKKQPYPHPLYHIINFSDCEGYIGPTAVKEMANFLKSKEGKELIRNVRPKSSTSDLVKIILETAKMESGYIRFS